MERLLMRAQEVAYRFSLLVCGHPEDAEDVMHEALLKTYQYVNHIAHPDAFRTWLYTTVRHACLMKRRRRAGEPAHFVSLGDRVPASDGTNAPVDVADAAGGSTAHRRLDGRPFAPGLEGSAGSVPHDRGHAEMEGLSTRDVAAVTGYSEANVKTRLRRARLMLRRRLQKI
jgi:RNA polymerase sigma-70 factor (ECF subfamily)